MRTRMHRLHRHLGRIHCFRTAWQRRCCVMVHSSMSNATSLRACVARVDTCYKKPRQMVPSSVTSVHALLWLEHACGAARLVIMTNVFHAAGLLHWQTANQLPVVVLGMGAVSLLYSLAMICVQCVELETHSQLMRIASIVEHGHRSVLPLCARSAIHQGRFL